MKNMMSGSAKIYYEKEKNGPNNFLGVFKTWIYLKGLYFFN